jgi:signal transduction histidine kinase
MKKETKMLATGKESVQGETGLRSLGPVLPASAAHRRDGGEVAGGFGRGTGSGAVPLFWGLEMPRRSGNALGDPIEPLAELLDGSPVPALMINCRREIVLWNRATEILTSIHRDDVLGSPSRLPSLFGGKSLPLLAEILLDASEKQMSEYRTNGSFSHDACLETIESKGYITVRGEKKILKMTATRIRSVRGRLIGVIQYARDVTREEQLQQYLMHAQKMESLGSLAGGVIHELNNVLMTIQGYSELMRTKLDARDPLSRYLATIDSTCARAAGMTRSMLDFARPGQPRRSAVELDRLLVEMQEMLVQVLPAHIELKLVLHGSLPALAADPDQIRQVIVNLVVNAKDAMPRGGTIRIRTGIEEVFESHEAGPPAPVSPAPGTYIRIDVEDDGEGMSREVRSRIFEPFFSTKGEGKGTGLGLFIVKSILDSHSGAMRVESKTGQGSRFRLLLPVNREG